MIATFTSLEWFGHDDGGALLFIAKAGTYQFDGVVPEMLKNEDVTVRYSPEKWDELVLKIVEEDETDVVVAGDVGPRFRFPRKIFKQLLANIN